MIGVWRVTPDDRPEWRAVRLRALEEAPDAFGSTLAERRGQGDVEGRWRERLRSVPLNLIALVGGVPAGQVSGTGTATDKHVEMISVWVAPETRGMGVGDALINAVVDWACDQSAEGVVLWVKRSNTHAIALYERHGFRPTPSPVRDGEQEMGLAVSP